MALLYSLSYSGMLASVVLWYFLDSKEKSKTIPKIALALCLVIYIFCLAFSGAGLLKMLWIVSRDFFIFLGILLIGHYLSSRTFAYLIVLCGISAVFFLFYFNVLYMTLAPKKVPLYSGGELLFDIGNHGDLAGIETALKRYGLRIEKAFPDLMHEDYSSLDEYYVVDVPDNIADHKTIGKIMEAMRDTGLVDWVERNEVVALSPLKESDASLEKEFKRPDYGPNDPELEKQWGFEKMNLALFYKKIYRKEYKPKKKALIAILDTGIDASHEDLKGNYFSLRKGYDTDKLGHGTHCAGIAGAVSNNRVGIASLVTDNRFVRITGIKVLDDQGSGSQLSIMRGMIEAVDRGADVLSLSLGGRSNDVAQKAYEEAVKYAAKAGAVVVVAAGNNDDNAGDYMPAGVKGVIAVSAVDRNLSKAGFSNTVKDIGMAVAAPGVEIYSTFPGNKYVFFNGTSMAAPFVAGLAGIMKSIDPGLSAKDVFRILKKTGLKTGNPKNTGPFIQPDKVLEAVGR